jgi:hypothetical protein
VREQADSQFPPGAVTADYAWADTDAEDGGLFSAYCLTLRLKLVL